MLLEEKNWIEPRKNGMNSTENTECGLTGSTLPESGKKHGQDTGETSGIYKIVNTVNGKYYVGSSDQLYRRWQIHYNRLDGNRHENSHLQNAWNKYGEDAFQFIIVEVAEPAHLLTIEQSYLDICKSCPNSSYNISYDAVAPMRGRLHTNETKEKMSGSHKGSRNVMFGKHHRRDTIQKIKEARKRQVFTTEQRERQSIAQRIPTIHKFFNCHTNEYFTGTQFDFRKKTGVNPYYLLAGLRPRYCWWTVENPSIICPTRNRIDTTSNV